ncbi:MAG: polysaccharide biosynthesis tyrosine autokinase [Phycisphaerae bacterium]|nr:polysaccharide biosynthesis tyrosine autokinase [Phycisphaerae bacterium]
MSTNLPSPPSSSGRPTAAGRPGPGPVGTGPATALDPIKLFKQHQWKLLVVAIVGAFVGLGGHFGLLYLYPFYQSMVIYQCLPPIDDPTKSQTLIRPADEIERFMATQVRIIQSQQILQDVVRDAAVKQTKWAKRFERRSGSGLNEADAMYWLKYDLSARVIPQTDLVELTMTWRDKEDVATVVNTVDRIYRADLDVQGKKMLSDRRQALSTTLNQLREEIARIDQLRSRLLGEGGLNALEGMNTTEQTKIQSISPRLVEAQNRLDQFKNTIQKYDDMIAAPGGIQYPDDLRADVERDNMVQRLQGEIGQLRSRYADFTQRYGPKHKEAMSLLNQIDSRESELSRVRDELLKKFFEGDYETAKRSVSSLERQIKEMEKDLADANGKKEEIVRKLVRNAELEEQKKKAEEQESELSKSIKELDTLQAMNIANRVRVYQRGEVPDDVIFPLIWIMVPLGMVLVTGFYASVVLVREVLDQRVKGPSDIALIPRMRVLGAIPIASEDPSKPPAVETAFRDTPMGAVTEAYRQIRAPLVRGMQNAGHKTLVVLSGMPGSGATSLVCNLALGCAAAEIKVLIIDANLRRPNIHRVFRLAEGPGLGDVLARTATLDSAVQETNVANLHVLTAGTAAGRSIPERLSTHFMGEVLGELRQRYDLILLDSAPATVSGDAQALAARCDAAVLVVRALAEKRGLVARVAAQLGQSHAEFLGVVVNAVRASAGGYFKRNIQATHEYQSGAAPRAA